MCAGSEKSETRVLTNRNAERKVRSSQHVTKNWRLHGYYEPRPLRNISLCTVHPAPTPTMVTPSSPKNGCPMKDVGERRHRDPSEGFSEFQLTGPDVPIGFNFKRLSLSEPCQKILRLDSHLTFLHHWHWDTTRSTLGIIRIPSDLSAVLASSAIVIL